MFSNLIRRLYSSPVFARLFRTLVYTLHRELIDCTSVLDLGCGPNSPVQYCGATRTVGVECFRPYYDTAKANHTHSELQFSRIEDLSFPANSFDAVTMIEVIEHLPKDVGKRMLASAETWARKKVIVTSPNGFIPQKALDDNPLQEHLSGWNVPEMRELGFRCHGLAGLKVLRHERDSLAWTDDLTVLIRFRPRQVWFVISALSQLVTFHFPRLAFGVFSVKDLT